ncbi:hypothetical protein SAMN05660337_3280 [Maridesulfovibrio ferrireducens]|uniref:Uncharacterized protein n=1 Tax=Maridesulfovibrio ferrireducens TaxID=246191 RepID=A0A1G9L577_9BACT|nr:BrnT family toxin [Maridesulfovibrio ferrireducens]SDL57110.1 hypothetical protein SAMN05660337_3280 [Maridesulfovibrio ferrireducens]
MQFEYDNNKSVSNLEKHGIDFKQAQALWNDPNLLAIPARTQDEPRIFFIGIINGKHWSAVTTPRNGVTRIISVRRSRKKEVELYES